MLLHSQSPQPRHPLASYAYPAVISGTEKPVPLIGTSFDVQIDAGLAVVTATRRFRNVEEESIEVTMTFPVPVHAVLFQLSARIGERRLEAIAQAKVAARDTYERAIDQGRSAVLHEEVLRGIHQLSVAHVPPGQEIAVEASWAMPLAAVPGGAKLHIPVTVGEIYGASPLDDSDDFFHQASVQEAELSVTCRDGTVALTGGVLQEGRARLRLDAPIVLEVSGWQPRALHGIAADGRGVEVEISRQPLGDLPLDAAILVDRSGSMAAEASGLLQGAEAIQAPPTKHGVVVAGLLAAASSTLPGDRIDLWEFDHTAGKVRGRDLAAAARRLSPPGGGTEIGHAIEAVLASRPTRDVLLITDGKSHAIDVQAAARSGRRFHVVLIGEDSLEAHVGYLAALTGGQIFVAAGLEAGSHIRQALAAMRLPHLPATQVTDPPSEVEAMIGGMRVKATWHAGSVAEPGRWSRAVAAFAASLALPRLPEPGAAALAEAEGLVTHLTSLVLVDEQGEAQSGLPAQRRVGLMVPRTAPLACSDSAHPALALYACDSMPPPGVHAVLIPAYSSDLAALCSRIDWAAAPEALRRGDLSPLPAYIALEVEAAAEEPEIIALAAELGVPPAVLVLALMAQSVSKTDRAAARFARAVLGGATAASGSGGQPDAGREAALRAAAAALGL